MDALVLKGFAARVPRFIARTGSVHILRLCIIALVLAFGANIAMAQQVTLSMPDTLVNPSTSVSVPIRVTGFYHVGAFSLTISFDKNVLTYTGLANQPAGVLSTSAAAANANGAVSVTWFSTSAMNLGSGTLLNLLFTMNSGSSALTFTGVGSSSVSDSLGNPFSPLPSFTNGRVRTPGSDLPPGAPTLAYPSNEASNLATSFTLSWNAASGATSYRFQLSTDSGFGTTIVDDSTLSGTSRLVSGLSSNQTYYWRVKAKNLAGSSIFSLPWSFITAPPPPPPPTLLTPANAATNQSLTPTLTWNPSAGATSYRLQVSATADFASTVIDMSGITSTSQLVSSLSGSYTYYWRVSAANGGGSSAFSAIWSFQTQAGPPSIPTLLLPADNATAQPTSLFLSWNPSVGTGGITYTLQVSTTSNFSVLIVNDNTLLGTTRQATGLLTNTTYYWRVSATTQAGGTSLPSTVRSFTTVPSAPAAPTLNAPADGATGVDVNMTLTWNASSGATTYRIQVSTVSNFATTVVDDSTVTLTSKSVTGLSTSTLYYWRVSATNAGGSSAFSASRMFTTGAGLLPPALVFPDDGTLGVSPTAASIAWALAAGATSYRVQIATDAAFSNVVFDTSAVTARSIVVTSLAYNTTYYWHVNSAAGVITSAYSNSRSFTTLAGPPSAPVLSSPPNGSVGIPTSLSLTWNASAGASAYRVQLSTASDFSTTIVNDSVTTTSKAVTGLTTGAVYYWRVSASNTNGTSAFSATWSFTAGGATPVAPTLISPVNGAANQTTTMTFSWSPSIGATSYHLQVAYNETFTLMAYNYDNLTTTSQGIIGLSQGLPYYWRVSASNAAGSSAYSTVWSFSTATNATATSLTIPDTVAVTGASLSLPVTVAGFYHIGSFSLKIAFDNSVLTYVGLANQAVSGMLSTEPLTANSQGSVGISWFNLSPALNLGSGTLVNLVFTYKGGTCNISFTDKNPSSITDSLAANITATYNNGRVRDASTIAPGAPALLSPANAATNQAKNLTLTWSPSVGATSYRLQVSTVSTFASTVYDQSGLTSTSQAMSALLNGTTYYWQVNATNTIGTSAFSPYRSFTTIVAAPAAPTLATPANGVSGISLNPTLTWNASTGATSYRLQVATDSTFVSVVLDSMVTATQKAIGPLVSNTKYYWRVNASNVGGASLYSNIWNFTAVIPPPAAPILVTPATGATAVSISPTLTWNASTGATGYRLQVATDSAFASIVLNDSTLTATQRLVGPLTNNVKYFWRVSAMNVGGFGTYSTAWNFTTIALIPTAPALVSPANGVTGLGLSLTLAWTGSAGATSYQLQIASDSAFATVVLVDSTLTATQRQIGPLPNGTKYYWRVNATSSGGTSPYSSAWSFTTIVATPVTPTLLTPVDGARNVPVTLTLAWNPSSGTAFYRIQVASNVSFTQIVLDDSMVTSASRSVGPLSYNTLYFWRVRAKNDGGTTAYSDPWSFLTVVAPPLAPTLLSPADSEINVSLGPTLRWNAADGATSYHLQVSMSASFGTRIVDDTTLTGAQSSIGPLTLANTYYWRVRAKNAGGYSAYSSTRSFRTILTTSVERIDGAIPTEYALTQNYPNPFNPSTTIQYDIPASGPVSLKLYSILGAQVSVLVDQHQSAGRYIVRVNAQSLPSGIYLYQLRAGSFVQTKRMILVK